MMWLIWLVIAVVLIVVELFTIDLIAVWFAVSALIMAIVAAIFPELFFVWQILIFIGISAVLLLSTRKLVKKLMKKHKDQETNLELVLNHTGHVVEDINNDMETGSVKINGIIWSARSEDESIILKDEFVTVNQIKGNKLIVAKKIKSEENKC